MSGNSIVVQLRRIDALAKQNEEIIKKIDLAAATAVNLFTYVIFYSDGIYSVEEQRKNQQGSRVANDYREAVELAMIPDIFNDKINYSCRNYQDLKRLNGQMLLVARKYELFGESDKAHQEITKFENNFRLIQLSLQKITELLSNGGGGGRLGNIQAQLDNVNNQIKALRTSYPNVIFQNPARV